MTLGHLQEALVEHLLGQFKLVVVHQILVHHHYQLLARLQGLQDAARTCMADDQVGLVQVVSQRRLVPVDDDLEVLLEELLGSAIDRQVGQVVGVLVMLAVANLKNEPVERVLLEQVERVRFEHVVDELFELGGAYGHKDRLRLATGRHLKRKGLLNRSRQMLTDFWSGSGLQVSASAVKR